MKGEKSNSLLNVTKKTEECQQIENVQSVRMSKHMIGKVKCIDASVCFQQKEQEKTPELTGSVTPK